ncbi:hypothetical protein [Nonomuraea dietziae]|uniref:hypothetical protein n=1 Tax=Nonomuraea dietziae TaxID=65515 RepID=UPI0031DD1349
MSLAAARPSSGGPSRDQHRAAQDPIEATQEERFPGDVHWYDLPDDDVELDEDDTLPHGPSQAVA